MTKLKLFSRCAQVLALVCGLLQVGIDRSYENLISVTLVVLSSMVLYEYIMRSRVMFDHPISGLTLIGLNTTSTLVALIAQSLSGMSFIHSLRAPTLTFGLLSGLLMLAVLTHWIYANLAFTTSIRNWLAERLFQPLGLLEAPNVWVLWAMALIGAASTLKGGAAFGDVNGKVFQALGFLQWMPFAIPLYYRKWGRDYCDMRLQTTLLILFVLLLAAIGLMRNARQLMLIGPFQAALTYFLVAAQDPGLVTRRTIVKAASIAVATLVGITAFADLSAAMTVAREKRETSTPMQVVEETFALLSEPEKLNAYRTQLELASKVALYDEAYLRNPVLARLSETKFHDNMVYFGSNFRGNDTSELWDITGFKLLQAFPLPLLEALDIDIDKSRNAFSMGDYYRYLNEGETVLGGYATGSMWADVYALFGLWLPFAAFGLMMIIFLAFDGLSKPSNLASISPILLGSTFIIFEYGLGADSLATKLAFLMRDWPQKIVLYLLVYQVLRLFSQKRFQA